MVNSRLIYDILAGKIMTLTPKYRFINMDQTETADSLKNLTYTFIWMCYIRWLKKHFWQWHTTNAPKIYSFYLFVTLILTFLNLELCLGKGSNFLFSIHLSRFFLINGTSKLYFGLKADPVRQNSTKCAIANRPQSKEFGCGWTLGMWIFSFLLDLP